MKHLRNTVILLLLALTACGPRGKVEVGPVEFLPKPLVGFYPEFYEADTTEVRVGDSFTGMMNRLGLGASQAYLLTQRCEGTFDVRKLIAGKEVQAYYDTTPEGERKLSYVVYVEDRIHSTVFQCADSLAVWKVEKPVEHVRRQTDVTINSSLWNDMIAAGGSPNLIMTLADIYQWSVNFFTLQKGDRFRMIYNEMVSEGEVIGVDNAPILDNAQRLAKAGAKLQIRIPTIPMFNNSRDSYRAFGEFILELGDAVETVQLLPYHNLGVVKWERLGRSGPALEAIPPSDAQMQSLKKQLEDMGVKNVIIH